jgi:aminoglycoside/choline kinase family phosphotransferase
VTRNDAEILATAVSLSEKMPEGPLGAGTSIQLLSDGGSDRTFYRVSERGRTAVLLVDSGEELERYLGVCRFLRDCGIAAPECYAIDVGASSLLMEDLGSLHLDTAVDGSEPGQELGLYRECIDMIVSMETTATERMLETGFLGQRRFGMQVLIGETDYFAAEFIGRYCPVQLDEGWEEERTALARFLASQNPVFMHRDFQSRNLIVKEGRIRVIDFQSAHRGPGLYDVASLLKDPYHPLPAELRLVLLEELHGRLKERSAPVPREFEAFHEAFVLAGIQRNLQALAAFVRLGVVKGKKRFLESIPPALDLLEEGIDESGIFPAMKRMVEAIREESEKGRE